MWCCLRCAVLAGAVYRGLARSLIWKSENFFKPLRFSSISLFGRTRNFLEWDQLLQPDESLIIPQHYHFGYSLSQILAIFLSTSRGFGVKLSLSLQFPGMRRNSPDNLFGAERSPGYGAPVCSCVAGWRVLFHPSPLSPLLIHNYQTIVIQYPVESVVFVLVFLWGRLHGLRCLLIFLNGNSKVSSAYFFYNQSEKRVPRLLPPFSFCPGEVQSRYARVILQVW